MAVARATTLKPLHERIISVTQKALIVGGGISGMNAALSLAGQGFDVTLVEKESDYFHGTIDPHTQSYSLNKKWRNNS